ncbi:MAG TPA: outer membrane beta-barrel family protein [Chitinophagaceae bacterium]|jgi:hypothetical protein|nr:outer membrane beta-barrel family protein [Chitinophagaceae bacterium]
MKKNQLTPAILTASLFFSIATQAQQTNPVKDSINKKDSALVLTGVTVTSQKQFIEQAAGKIVLNVSASPVAAGTNAYEVLLKAPGMIEQEQSLQFRNKTINVLINGRPSNLSGEELKAMLSAMPANSIEKVEVLTNASASYDAEGGVVVDIKLAKNKNLGTNGILTLGAGAGMYGRYNGGLSLNNRSKKTNIYGSYDANATTQYRTSESFRLLDANIAIDENEFRRNYRESHIYKLGIDHDINKSSSIGILFRGLNNTLTRNSDNTSLVDQLNGANDSSSTVTTTSKTKISNPSLNLYYRLSTGKGNELVINADYFSHQKNWDDAFTTRYFDDKDQAYRNDYQLRNHSEGDISVKSISADYTHTNKSGKWEMGLKTTFNTTDNNTIWEYQSGNNWVNDAGKTNHFIYKENINAAYLKFSKEIKQFGIEAGLRTEYTRTEGVSKTLGQTDKNDYINLFPSVAINYNASEDQQWGLSYRRSITRFDFDVVNPFTTYVSQYRYSQGNPMIKPSYADNFELTHTYKSKLMSTIGYGHYTNVVAPVFKKDAGSDAVINTMDNLHSGDQWEASVSYMESLLKGKWMMTNTIGGLYAILNDPYNTGSGSKSGGVFISSSNVFRFSKGWTAEISGSYLSAITVGVLHCKPTGGLNAGVSKSLFKNNTGKLTLNISDIFNTQRQKYSVSSFGIASDNNTKPETRVARLTFTWKFGNKNVKANKNRATGIEDQKSRTETN